ncbi:rRNA-processing protein EBP2 [Erysiphe neolycopersici]|uniref:rRNA-processing protein EBP2 n=1 Tax=Erysiphe neolycopersici TaxID=212602 RepID=A0A420I400_9PEZI|nr:rRNA-processing protein EBP2 [Erysiphe neolycopersici]
MVTKSKLKMALLAEKEVDFKKLSMKKKEKASRKKKSLKSKDIELNGSKSNDDDESDKINAEKENQNDEDDEDKTEKKKVDENKDKEKSSKKEVGTELSGVKKNDHNSSAEEESEDSDGESEDEDEDIPVSDLEDLDDDDKEDLIPHQRLTINDTVALTAALNRISLPISKLQFSEHQSVTTSEPISIPDISDDLNRELAFYAQSLAAAKEGRKKLKVEGVQFTRPNDYFAEMVKPDEHMAKIKAKLIDEAASKKASAEARKQRDLKKFGKQVQVAKLQERDMERKSTLEKIKLLKRKRQGTTAENENEADIFDVAVDEEIKSTKFSKEKRDGLKKRQKKDEKFGFGGRKKFKKSGDAISTGDLKGFSTKKMKSVTKNRPGKARRASKR